MATTVSVPPGTATNSVAGAVGDRAGCVDPGADHHTCLLAGPRQFVPGTSQVDVEAFLVRRHLFGDDARIGRGGGAELCVGQRTNITLELIGIDTHDLGLGVVDEPTEHLYGHQREKPGDEHRGDQLGEGEPATETGAERHVVDGAFRACIGRVPSTVVRRSTGSILFVTPGRFDEDHTVPRFRGGELSATRHHAAGGEEPGVLEPELPSTCDTSVHGPYGADDPRVDLPVPFKIDPGEWLLALFRDGFFRLPGTPAVWHGEPDLPVRDVVTEYL